MLLVLPVLDNLRTFYSQISQSGPTHGVGFQMAIHHAKSCTYLRASVGTSTITLRITNISTGCDTNVVATAMSRHCRGKYGTL
jgi:hypothetical protein